MTLGAATGAVPGWHGMLGEGAQATGWVDGDALVLICHNGGRGSAPIYMPIAERETTHLTVEYDGAHLIVDGDRPARFLVRVDGADDTMVLASIVGELPEPVKVRYKGGRYEAPAHRLQWTPEQLGVPDDIPREALGGKEVQPLDGEDAHWVLEEGSLDQFIEAWHERRRRRDEGRTARRERDAQRRREESRQHQLDSHFINPYTFVPLPAGGPVRSSPPGHDRCADDRPLVRIDVTWQATTPLATRTPYRQGDGRTGLAGSAVKGALRSLHEALTGSCLRVVDLDAAPAYREQMQAGQGANGDDPQSWRRLARVREITEPDRHGERTLTLEVAHRTVWVPSSALDLPLISGEPYDVSRLQGTVEHDKALRRYQFTPGPGADPPFDPTATWIPLVSDAGARSKGCYHVPLGEFRGAEARVKARSETWRRYEQAALHSKDEVIRRRGDTPELEVVWDRKHIGRRQEVRSALSGPHRITPDHLFWVHVVNGEVTHLAAAYVWRSTQHTTVRDRVPSAFWPCSDPSMLCPSCQVFGSGGTTDQVNGDKSDDGHGYRGHVRVGPLLTSSAATRRLIAQLNAPRVGSGQFYLEPPEVRGPVRRGERALREWGSSADGRGPRPLRGRKFYWPADPETQRRERDFVAPRWAAEQTPYGQQGRGQEADVWDAGTVFRQTLTVIGLDSTRLGGLLAAIQPALLAGPNGAGWADAVVRMGYGKPFGLGVVRATAVEVSVHTPTDRYGPAQAPPRTVPAEEQAVWVADFAASLSDSVREAWSDLRAVTDPNHVWPEYVTYPVDSWDDYPRPGRPPPDPRKDVYRFEFWKQSAGGDRSELVPLPPARAAEQRLPLVPGKEDA